MHEIIYPLKDNHSKNVSCAIAPATEGGGRVFGPKTAFVYVREVAYDHFPQCAAVLDARLLSVHRAYVPTCRAAGHVAIVLITAGPRFTNPPRTELSFRTRRFVCVAAHPF